VVQWSVEPSVSYTAEVAFGSDPWATSPVWTDISQYVRSISTNRGSSSETVVFAPGRCSITLSNGDRRFDPDHSTGPYFGTILPMKRVRVTATRSGVTLFVFLGWVTGWVQDWRIGDGAVYAECVDGGYHLQNERLASSSYAAEVMVDAPTAYWPLQSDLFDIVGGRQLASNTPGRDGGTFGTIAYPVGDPAALIGGEPGSAVADYVGTFGTVYAIEAWVTTVLGEGSSVFLRSGADGSIGVSWDSVRPRFNLSYENAADNVGLNAGPTPIVAATPGLHHIALHATATTLTFLLDGQVALTRTFTLADTAEPDENLILLFDGGSSVSHVAVYQTAPSISRLQAHYLAGIYAYGDPYGETEGERIGRVLDEIGHPTNLRDISAGGVIQGPYLPAERTAMEYIGDCATSGQGLLFFSADGKITYRDRAWQWINADTDGIVFSDDRDAGSIAYDEGSPRSSIEAVRNSITCTYSEGRSVTNSDTTSREDYGPSEETINAPTIRNVTDASNLSKYVLRIKKNARSVTPDLVVKMRSNIATNFLQVLGIELGDVVTVKRTPMRVGAQIARRHQVTGISHTIQKTAWTTQLYLSPAIPMADEVPYWTIGHATYGRVGAPAGNRIPG
jgi:hypothetical protein